MRVAQRQRRQTTDALDSPVGDAFFAYQINGEQLNKCSATVWGIRHRVHWRLHRGARGLRPFLYGFHCKFAQLFQLMAKSLHLLAHMRILYFHDITKLASFGELHGQIEVGFRILARKRSHLLVQVLDPVSGWIRRRIETVNHLFACRGESLERLSRLLNAGFHNAANRVGKFSEIWCVLHGDLPCVVPIFELKGK